MTRRTDAPDPRFETVLEDGLADYDAEKARLRDWRAVTPVAVDFHALEFYARHGWEESGRIAGAPGVERILMRKTFTA